MLVLRDDSMQYSSYYDVRAGFSYASPTWLLPTRWYPLIHTPREVDAYSSISYQNNEPVHPIRENSQDYYKNEGTFQYSMQTEYQDFKKEDYSYKSNVVDGDKDRHFFECRWKNCTGVFTTLSQLSRHVSTNHAETKGGLFYCSWEGCSRSHRAFNARYKMLVHVRTHTNEKPHKCKQCDKSFSRAENLKIHIRSHSGEKPYVCPIEGCNKSYSNSSDRFKHTKTHLVEKPYFCKIPGCFKRYTDPSSLRKHVKTFKHSQIAPKPNIPEEPHTSDESMKETTKSDFHNLPRNFETTTEDKLVPDADRTEYNEIDLTAEDSQEMICDIYEAEEPLNLITYKERHFYPPDLPLDLSMPKNCF